MAHSAVDPYLPARAPRPVALDAVCPRLAITDADGAMADLGCRVQEQYPGAATTSAGVRAIRESWAKPSLWRRLVVRVTVR